MKKRKVESTLVLEKIVERFSKKLSEETSMLNHVVYLLRVTNVSGNLVRKKFLMDTKSKTHQRI